LKKFRKAQITQYPAATPKAKAATMVSRSMVERKNVVISTQSIVPAHRTAFMVAPEYPAQVAIHPVHAAESLM